MFKTIKHVFCTEILIVLTIIIYFMIFSLSVEEPEVSYGPVTKEEKLKSIKKSMERYKDDDVIGINTDEKLTAKEIIERIYNTP
jgi:uncharacterized protein YpuA (DUF1002 family)